VQGFLRQVSGGTAVMLMTKDNIKENKKGCAARYDAVGIGGKNNGKDS
jgi:hypothetical protein